MKSVPRAKDSRLAVTPSRLVAIAAVAIACPILPASAGDHGRLWQTIAQPFKALHRQAPPAGCETPVDGMARQVDWLLHHINTHGSIVAKEPDVWGQNRLTQHRYDYEEQMRRQLGMFSERTSAALRRSDQSYLGLALALQSASGNRRTAQQVAVPDVTSTSNVFNTVQGLIPSGNETGGRADPIVIARTAPMAFPQSPVGYQFDAEPLALEPTIHLDQLSRYLTHLNQLRRVNEGDDSADSPGYSLNLVRVPVSITPGGHTQSGYGAEITFTAEPILGDDLLPTTFRSLVVNDLIDIIAPALTWCVNDAECRAWAATITESAVITEGSAPSTDAAPAPARRQGVMAAMRALSAKLPTIAPKSAPAVKTRRARLPIPFSQLADVSGIEQIAILIRDTHAALATHPTNQPCIDYLLVRSYLAEELEAAYEFLAIESRSDLWADVPAWNLAGLIRGRQATELASLRCRFFSAIGPDAGGQEIELLPGPVAAADDPAGICCEGGQPHRPLCRTTTAVLAWGILVESALLNERLIADIRESATALGQPAAVGSCAGPFYGPDPAAEARQAFNEYVRTRWPIRVFALDPVREEQNVDDTFSRRREAQIAMAVAAASGRLNAQALARYTRRTELDMATVALNQTAVGFSHGNDTFGWRFYPRVQSPPTRSGIAARGPRRAPARRAAPRPVPRVRPVPLAREQAPASDLLLRSAAEQPLGPEHEDHDQDGEHDRAGPAFAHVGARQRPHEADHHAPHHRAGDAADPAEHRRGERVESVLEPHLEADRVDVEAVDHARRPAEESPDEKRGRDHTIDVDAHEGGRRRVLGDRPHRLAQPCGPHEKRKREHERHHDHEHEQILGGELQPIGRQQIRGREELGKRPVGGAEPEQADVHEDERHPDRRHERRELRCGAERFVDEPIDGQVETAAEEAAEHDEQGDAGPRAALVGDSEPQPAHQRQRAAGAEHDQVAVGKIDQPDDAVDHRVTEGDERDQGAVGEADQALLQEKFDRHRRHLRAWSWPLPPVRPRHRWRRALLRTRTGHP